MRSDLTPQQRRQRRAARRQVNMRLDALIAEATASHAVYLARVAAYGDAFGQIAAERARAAALQAVAL